ncbi:hypothetical protein [Planococcus sp. ISL-109]|uniref:hypothetical protein n=1 Tax=Planococcus sp. ISL-109 TaxID=2819166 RepID=UPI001BE5B23B|nr:hypothetical protein [Planococcus sp. ISL-109]MBT2583222.1 hypothetical protein [Planococcus sp. ISL-109]
MFRIQPASVCDADICILKSADVSSHKTSSVYYTRLRNKKDHLINMTGLDVVELNMHVEDVMTRAEFEETSKFEEKNAPETGEVTRTLE